MGECGGWCGRQGAERVEHKDGAFKVVFSLDGRCVLTVSADMPGAICGIVLTFSARKALRPGAWRPSGPARRPRRNEAARRARAENLT